jgi:agmatine/peptidylarginine deiminase
VSNRWNLLKSRKKSQYPGLLSPVILLPYSLVIGLGIYIFVHANGISPVKGEIHITRRPSQILIPEFKQTEGVIMSEMLFEDELGGIALARAILDGKAQPVILSNQAQTAEETTKWLMAKGFSAAEAEKILVVGISHDTYWLRDFGPIPIDQSGPGNSHVLKLGDPIYRSDSLLNDTVPYQLGLYLRASVEHMPIYMDGGNFLSDGTRCYIAEGSKESLTFYDDRIMHYQITPMDELKEQLKFTLGCQEVVSFSDAPHEHIDMWAKIIDEKHAIVNRIPDSALELVRASDPKEFERLQKINLTLDAAAKTFAEYLEVSRMPMPIPFDKVFRTYTNSTIVNHVVAVPRYRKFIDMDREYQDQGLLLGYEQEVQKVYESLGFQVRFVEADQLIQHGGALHCATSQIPKLESRDVARSLQRPSSIE